MANATVPTPLISILTSASLCILKVFLFPEWFPDTRLTTIFLIVNGMVFGLWAIWKAFIYPSWASPLRHLPQPKSGALPLLGHAALTLKKPAGAAFLKFITDIPNDGLIRFSGIFNADRLLLTDPSSLAEVLVRKSYDFEKPERIRKFLRIVLGDGLVLTEGDEHKFQRKHCSPAFSFRHIRELYPIFWLKASDLAGRVAAEIYENPEPSDEHYQTRRLEGVVEINHWASKITMDIIGVAGLGREFNSLYNADDELIENYKEILEPSSEKALYFAANFLFPPALIAMLPWKLNQRLKATTAALRTICRELVQDKKATTETQKGQHIDILSLLIRSNNFADEMLVDQLLTFLAAGHETTSSAFTWGAYLLAKHPNIQTRLREEIRINLPSPVRSDPSIDLASTLESLHYLTAVCNEILRLYPPIPVTSRVATRDTTILSQHIPKGTRIYISPWAINRSPLLWGDTASDFVPERWIDAHTGRANNTGGVRSHYSNLTFLHGPRSCIGEKFAKSELKALMAVFVGTFQMEMADPNEVVTPAGAVTTKPENGLRLRLKVLDGW